MEEEIFRYLGMRPADADAAARELVRSCAQELRQAAAPRVVSMAYGVAVDGGGVDMGGCRFASQALAAHLAGCSRALAFAATLGMEVDRRILRYQRESIARAAVLNAAAAAYIEEICDAAPLETGGLFPRPRFSPGYGDFPLACQRPLLALSGGDKRLGLTLTSGMMLSPGKSVTAIIGLGPEPPAGAGSACGGKCARCGNVHCAYRLT